MSVEKTMTKIQEKYKGEAQRLLDKHNVLPQLADNYGTPLLLVLAGSHSFGFPSQNSDYDVRGVYLAPTEKFLGIRERAGERNFEYMSPDRGLDVSVEELGKFMGLVAKSNGGRVEWLNNPLTLSVSPEYHTLRGLVNDCGISKRLLNQYLQFARKTWEGQNGLEGVKRDLHALRAYMVGITLVREGQLVSDITDLNKRFNIPLIPQMIELKEQDEQSAAQSYDRQYLARMIYSLDALLARYAVNSSLPEKPNQSALNDFLVNLRKARL